MYLDSSRSGGCLPRLRPRSDWSEGKGEYQGQGELLSTEVAVSAVWSCVLTTHAPREVLSVPGYAQCPQAIDSTKKCETDSNPCLLGGLELNGSFKLYFGF